MASGLLHVPAEPQTKLKLTDRFHVMGKTVQRVDIPANVTVGSVYVQNIRLAGMLHARVVRPASCRARLVELDGAPVERMQGVVALVRDGELLAVVAEKELQAAKAMRAASAAARWEEAASLPNTSALPDFVRALPVQEDSVVADVPTLPVGAQQVYEAIFTRPCQIHGSIGPSCAVGLLEDGVTSVWTHTQGVFPIARGSRKCCAFRRTWYAASISRAPAAMAITVPTTRRLMPR